LRNKTWLVAKGYNQEERTDFGETYAPVASDVAASICLHEWIQIIPDGC